MWLWLAPIVAYLLVGAGGAGALLWDDFHTFGRTQYHAWFYPLLVVAWLPLFFVAAVIAMKERRRS